MGLDYSHAVQLSCGLLWLILCKINLSANQPRGKVGFQASGLPISILPTPYLPILGLQSQLTSAGGFHIARFCIYFYPFWGFHH